jgi:hypothetical protein
VKHTILSIVLLVSIATGCDENSVEDELELTIDSQSLPIQVDTVCHNGGCDSEGIIAFTVGFDEDAQLSDETEVEFLQYRIDYTVPSLASPIPFHAGRLQLLVYPEKASFGVLPSAGEKQRDFVVDNNLGDVEIGGKAVLTLAGYDQYDEQVFLETVFDISFGDFYDYTIDE